MSIVEKDRVLVNLDGKVFGPFFIRDLFELEGFSPQTLVSYPGSGKWAKAESALDIRSSNTSRNTFHPSAKLIKAEAADVPSSSDFWYPRPTFVKLLITTVALAIASHWMNQNVSQIPNVPIHRTVVKPAAHKRKVHTVSKLTPKPMHVAHSRKLHAAAPRAHHRRSSSYVILAILVVTALLAFSVTLALPFVITFSL